MKFSFQDIACKYRTWAEKVDPESSTKATWYRPRLDLPGKTQHHQLFYFMGDFLGLKQNLFLELITLTILAGAVGRYHGC